MKAQKWTPGWNRCIIIGQIRAGQWWGVDFRLRNQHPLSWWFCDDNMWQMAPELVSSAGHPLHYQGNLLTAWTSVYTHLKNWRKYLTCEEWRPKHCSGCKGSDEHEIFHCPKLSLLMFRIWRRQWHPTPVLLPGKSHGQRSLVGCSPSGRYELDMTERLHFHFSLSHIGEGNGNPLQCSCLDNPRDGGAWWAAIYGIAQGRTRLKWLSSSLACLESKCFKEIHERFDWGGHHGSRPSFCLFKKNFLFYPVRALSMRPPLL